MIWTPEWSFAARRDLANLHWQTAGRIDREVQDLASTGAGVLLSVPNVPGRFWLRVTPFVVGVSFDPATKTLHVWRVFRA